MLRRKKSSKGHRTHNDDIPKSRHDSKKVRRQRSDRRPESFGRNLSCRPYGLDNDVVQSRHCDRNDDQPHRNSPKYGDQYCFPTIVKKNWVVVITRLRPVDCLREVLRPSHKNSLGICTFFGWFKAFGLLLCGNNAFQDNGRCTSYHLCRPTILFTYVM